MQFDQPLAVGPLQLLTGPAMSPGQQRQQRRSGSIAATGFRCPLGVAIRPASPTSPAFIQIEA